MPHCRHASPTGYDLTVCRYCSTLHVAIASGFGGSRGSRSVTSRIDLNSDLGEGYGAWKMGDDAAMLAIVSSANVACGFHAGDPMTLLSTVTEAAARGVAIGAHISYPDLVGFGRRPMGPSPAQLSADVIYQIGALQGICAAAGTRVLYVKPHGALYNTIAVDAEQAAAVIDGIRSVDSELALMGLANSSVLKHAAVAGLRTVSEAFADRGYQPDGQLVPRAVPGSMLHDPEIIASRVLRLVVDNEIEAIDGTMLRIHADSVCVHGDNPAAIAIAARVRDVLRANGIEIRSSLDLVR